MPAPSENASPQDAGAGTDTDGKPAEIAARAALAVRPGAGILDE
jgi:hypothetical protein